MVNLLLQVNWFLCICILIVLLLQAFPHVWLPPDSGILWLHDTHLLHLLPHDGNYLLLCITKVRQVHLPKHQNGLIYNGLHISHANYYLINIINMYWCVMCYGTVSGGASANLLSDHSTSCNNNH